MRVSERILRNKFRMTRFENLERLFQGRFQSLKFPNTTYGHIIYPSPLTDLSDLKRHLQVLLFPCLCGVTATLSSVISLFLNRSERRIFRIEFRTVMFSEENSANTEPLRLSSDSS